MNDYIPFALPDITQAEVTAVSETLKSGWLATGPRTKEFESKFAVAVGSRRAVMVNSCTAAMHLALEAIGIRRGDEVIVPAITFAATAEVVRYFDAKPVIVDVKESDHNIDPEAVARAIGPRTKAIIPVHFAGLPCDLDEIMGLARDHGLPVVVDSAHCFPGMYRGRNVGTVGDVVCFSFYATKTLTTGEGGAAVTSNEALADRMSLMSLHGISRDAWKRYSAEGNWYYEIEEAGYKYNLTDIASSIGLVQLERSLDMLRRRREISQRYDEAFGSLAGLEVLPRPTDREHAQHLYVIKARRKARVGRDSLLAGLRERGIGTSVHFIPLHIHPYYRRTYGYRPEDIPVALDVYQRSLSLPVYSGMTDPQVDRVIEAVQSIVER